MDSRLAQVSHIYNSNVQTFQNYLGLVLLDTLAVFQLFRLSRCNDKPIHRVVFVLDIIFDTKYKI